MDDIQPYSDENQPKQRPEATLTSKKARKPRGLRLTARLMTRIIRPMQRLLVVLKLVKVIVLNRPTKLIGRDPVLVVANHCSDLDAFFLGGSLRRPVVFMAKKEIWDWRIAGSFMRLLGEIPVDRNDPVSRAAAPVLMGEVVQHGGAGIIFPEGTTYDFTYAEGTPVIGKLKSGVARIAYETNTPILVCGMRGTNQVLPPRRGAKLNRKAIVVLNFETELIDPVEIRKSIAGDDYHNPTPDQEALIIGTIMSHIESKLTQRVTEAYLDAGSHIVTQMDEVYRRNDERRERRRY